MNDLRNKRFGRLLAIEDAGSKRNRRMWKCRCDCGNEIIVASDSLTTGNTKSCGCLCREKRIETSTKHGQSKTRLYRIWKGIISRCRNERSTDYKWYGAKGISVCKEWLSFEPFKKWADENGYNDSLTIDRIDVFGNYEPSNCRWATIQEQNTNRRCNYESGKIRTASA